MQAELDWDSAPCLGHVDHRRIVDRSDEAAEVVHDADAPRVPLCVAVLVLDLATDRATADGAGWAGGQVIGAEGTVTRAIAAVESEREAGGLRVSRHLGIRERE